ncbi:MAG: glycosyltransferase family 4 protein [Anaerolineae bacterium]|nr:glycosyltransferase family 4 protein [Anaerolineae bacterium]
MGKSVAILHYAAPPTVGGVESTIYHHARGLAARGWRVRVVSGRGDVFDPAVESLAHPLFGSTAPEVLRVKRELDQGEVTSQFDLLIDHILRELRPALAGFEVVIAHNLPTFNKNLALTAALARLHAEGGFRLLAWAHDLAWTNPQYLPELYEGPPWDLLRRAWKDAIYVTVSEARRPEVADLIGIERSAVRVITPGVDVAEFFDLTEITLRLARDLNWFDADALLLLPARITRRKNIALALRILAEARRAGRDYRLIVSGPPGPHNPLNPGYLGELLELRRALNLEEAAHFLYEYGMTDDSPLIPDDAMMANLYQLADGLLFPPLSEGFGIPMLEAGLARLPIFCADIPPLRGTGGVDAQYFDPLTSDPAEVAGNIVHTLEGSAPYRLRLRTRREFRWEAIIDRQIIPLLNTEHPLEV